MTSPLNSVTRALLVALLIALRGTISVSGLAAQENEAPGSVSNADAAVRDAVARSLPFLEKEGVAWMDERMCMSCHHVPLLLWTHRAARARGLSVDAKKLAEWDGWSSKDSLANRYAFKLQKYELGKVDVAILPNEVREKLKPLMDLPFVTEAEFLAKLTPVLNDDERAKYQAQVVKAASIPLHYPNRTGGGLDVLAQLLLGGHQAEETPASSEFRSGVIQLIKERQLADGSWTPGNQFATMRTWPLPAANQTTTMWAALALARYKPTSESGKLPESIERALAYQRQQPAQSDNREWIAVRLLFELQFGSLDDVATLRRQLVESRNPDGGWSWQKDNPSDPYTTGIALYALAKVREDAAAAAILEARNYLIAAQQPNGSWLTPARFISKTSDPERLAVRDEIYHYWGTAWSVIGLLETLPPNKPVN
jgi:hypothetical protein